MKFKYTEEQLEFLRVGYKDMFLPALTVAFNQKFNLNKKECALRSIMARNKIKCTLITVWTEEHREFIERLYNELTAKELLVVFNRHFGMERTLGQLKEFIQSRSIYSGRTGQFVKGNQPVNWQPIGTVVLEPKNKYLKIKVAEPNKWRFVHRMIWEEKNGPVPNGHMIIFVDGNIYNFRSENLKLISRSINAYLNAHGYHDLTGDLRLSAIAMAAVAQKAARLKKEARV